MRRPRWAKLFRDLLTMRGRMTMMAAAIGLSVLGLGAVLTTMTILNREIRRNYMGTNPASATIEVENLDQALVDAARTRPHIADAQARGSVLARFQVGSGAWQPLLLFVIKDFDAMRISTFAPETGSWPPPAGTVLLERAVLPLFGIRTGDTVTVKTPHGRRHDVPVSGTVHDPGLAPAWQEQMGYGYITQETLAWLGEPSALDELKLTVDSRPLDQGFITRTAQDLAAWLEVQGHRVASIQVPPPGKHPHQGQMTALLTIFMVFSVLSLILSGVLVAALVSSLLAKEVRQVGVMKAIGARTGQMAAIYAAMIVAVGAVAIAAGMPLGVLAGRAFAMVVANLLNFTIHENSVPAWVYALMAAAGLLVPLLVSMGPILRASRRTVREALSDHGVSVANVGRATRRVSRAWQGVNRRLLLALRNATRRRGRLVLTVGLLAAGGAIFTMALNVSWAWQVNQARSFKGRLYDFEIRLGRPESVSKVKALLERVPGVGRVEPWGMAPAARWQNGGVEISHTYPDGGHGSFSFRGVPADTRAVVVRLLAGRWVDEDDTNAAVLNPMARALFPRLAVGDTIALATAGNAVSWRVVGFVDEIGPASAYVPERTFEGFLARPGSSTAFRVIALDKSPAARNTVIGMVENELEREGIGISAVIADAAFRNAIADHISVLVFALLFMAVLIGGVGMLGCATTMSTSVVERTRELGVMRAIGGTPAAIQHLVAAEAAFIGLLGLVAAAVVTVPLSFLVGRLLGDLAFKTPLPLAISMKGVLLWLGIALVGSAVSSAVPAWRASRLTVRETISYE